jgi:hypothetical protein
VSTRCTALTRRGWGCHRSARRDGFCTQHHPDWPERVEAQRLKVKAEVEQLLAEAQADLDAKRKGRKP